MGEAFELDGAECEALLRAGVVGRVAVVAQDGPHIIPVNYGVVDDAIVIRTSPYGVLGTEAKDAAVAFEVDQVDYEYQHGWSVLARGRAEVVDDPEELAEIRETCWPTPWAGGGKPLVIRIRWDELTGRRLGSGWSPLDELPVHRAG